MEFTSISQEINTGKPCNYPQEAEQKIFFCKPMAKCYKWIKSKQTFATSLMLIATSGHKLTYKDSWIFPAR